MSHLRELANIYPVPSEAVSLARVVAFKVSSNGSGGVGPFDRSYYVQFHGVSDARVNYTLVPPLGGLGSVSPDVAALPVSGFPLVLPLGATIIINNIGAGDRAYTASIWPMG